jgi:5-methylthioadenosine/S-adenosylhomocysteine deaminase
MACKNGAYAMGLSNSDCLSVGKKADLILIDLQQPNMQPIHNIPKNLVYSGSKQNVVLTMVDGKILFEKGEFFLDEPAHIIYEKTDKIVRRILSEA